MIMKLPRLKSNEMIQSFIHLKGNPKACVCTEPLWYIPYNLFIPFATCLLYTS